MPQFESEKSSNIGWSRYDEATQVLEVDFKNAAGVKTSTYKYEGFAPSEWTRFNEALSKGRHFAYEIRPRYVGVKVWPK